MTTCTCGAVRTAPVTTECERCTDGNHGTPIAPRIVHNARPRVDHYSI